MASSNEASGMRTNRRLYPGPLPERRARKTVRQAFEIVRRGKWLIIAATVLVVGAAAFYTRTLPETTYSATALLLVDSQSSRSADEALSYGYVDARSAGGRNLNNQVLILQQSLTIAERTAERLLAMESIPETGRPLSIAARSPRELAMLIQSGYISISAITDRGNIINDAIRVTARSTVPAEAVLIANTYAEEYVNRTQQESRQRIVASREFLEEQVAKRQQELRRWEEQIKDMGRAGAIGLDAETQRTIGQIANLEAQLDEARIEKSMREASLRSSEQELAELHPKLVQRMASGVAKEIDLTQQKIAELELVIGEYESRRSTQPASVGSQVDDLKRQIDLLKSHVRELSDQYVSEMLTSGGLDPKAQANGYVAQLNQKMVDERIAISGIDAKIAALDRRVGGYSQKLENIPQQSMQLAQAHRARQTAEAMFLRLTEKLEEATLAEESKVGYAEVLRPALSAYGPQGDPRMRILTIGLLLGILLGILAALARHKLDERIYTPDDVKDKDFYLLSTIPDMKSIVKTEFGKRKTVEVDGKAINPMLLSLLRPQTAAAEAYRRLYLSIQFSRPDTVVQTILVTSPEAGAGKSTTALNLAATAARTGRRTLIVDADLRQPSIHSYLSIKAKPGLSERLKYSTDYGNSFELPTILDNLFVLPAGEAVPDSTRILSSKEMRALIQQLRSEFDVIIFDSPPVMLATDAAIISTQSDATVVVASAGSTASDALKQSMEELRNVGAPVVGTILNRFDPSHIYGYQDTYGYLYKQYEYAAR